MAGVLYAKRGDTFRLQCRWTDADGEAEDVSGFEITSQLRKGDVVIDLGVSVTDAADGRFELVSSDVVTEDWVTMAYECDVQAKSGINGTGSSETFMVAILEDVTRDA